MAKALARVSGGLYVVTAERGGAKGAMIASWVAQASFEPLGLTIAVAKDRAIESLMQVWLTSGPRSSCKQPTALCIPDTLRLWLLISITSSVCCAAVHAVYAPTELGTAC